MVLRVLARSTVAMENFESFRVLVKDVTASVREKEAGKTLTYDFYLADNNQENNCAIHEAFTDADAMVQHLKNLGPYISRFQALIKTNELHFFGAVPQALLDQMKAVAPVTVHAEYVGGV